MKHVLFKLLAVLVLIGCEDAPSPQEPATYDPTPWVPDPTTLPFGYTEVPQPADYPLTKQRVLLGRMLFYDGKLSSTLSQSCATCHTQFSAFTDLRQFSIGVKGLPGHRHAMILGNLAWHRRGFFWDGRSPTLRDQALRPIQDTLEMNETLPNVVAKLSADRAYRDQFIRAFGNDSITPERIGIALEAFMLTLTTGNSKWDRWKRGQATFTDQEQRGQKLFVTEFDPTGREKGAECFHCHAEPTFTNDRYMNNGLDDDATFTDLGRELVTGRPSDRAKFKTPSLRNIAITPPYMHDGRFTTLEEVIRHYDHGVKRSSTVDPLLQFSIDPGLGLSEADIADLVAFLKTLTDESFRTNPAHQAP